MRTSTHGLGPGTPIRISNASSRRHARGRITRLLGGMVEYRSDGDASLRLVRLEDVHAKRSRAGRRSQEVA